MPTTDTVSTDSTTSTLSIASSRKFGVEIEFVGISIDTAVQALEDAGIPVNHRLSNGYNHCDLTDAWKVVTDASVHGGGEAVSPILSGIEGLEQVRKAADAINNAGATARRSCGLHVHVDARDLSVKDLANVVIRYGEFETAIDTFMPNSRRGGSNTYCRSVVSHGRFLREATGLLQPSDIYRYVGDCRFHKVNMQAYNAHGSIEFRQHSGTVQSGKILPWIQFCVNFVEKSRVRRTRRQAPATEGRARDSKTLVAMHKIVNTLRAAGFTGVSKEDLAELTGKKASSVVVYISNLRTQYGFEIKCRRGRFVLNRNGRLPVLASQEPNREPVTEEVTPVRGDNAFRGLPANIVSYFTERTEELAA